MVTVKETDPPRTDVVGVSGVKEVVVCAGRTVCVTPGDVLATKRSFPPYTAVMA